MAVGHIFAFDPTSPSGAGAKRQNIDLGTGEAGQNQHADRFNNENADQPVSSPPERSLAETHRASRNMLASGNVRLACASAPWPNTTFGRLGVVRMRVKATRSVCFVPVSSTGCVSEFHVGRPDRLHTSAMEHFARPTRTTPKLSTRKREHPFGQVLGEARRHEAPQASGPARLARLAPHRG